MSGFRSRWVGRPGRTGRDGRSWNAGVLVGILGMILFTGVSVRAQGLGRTGSRFVPDSSEEAERKLRNAATHARDHQWAEAIEIYQRVIDQYGDKVVKRPKDEAGADPSGDFPLYVNGATVLPPMSRPVTSRGPRALPQPDGRTGRALVP